MFTPTVSDSVIREGIARLLVAFHREDQTDFERRKTLYQELASFGLAYSDAEFNTATGERADAYLNG